MAKGKSIFQGGRERSLISQPVSITDGKGLKLEEEFIYLEGATYKGLRRGPAALPLEGNLNFYLMRTGWSAQG